MNIWKWPNVHPASEVLPVVREIDPSPESLPTGRVKVKCAKALRGWKIIPACELKPGDKALAYYPE